MHPIPLTLAIPAPLPLFSINPRPVKIGRVRLRELCDAAGIQLRVTGGRKQEIVLHQGVVHYRTPKALYIGVGKNWKLDRVRALRVLEVLAYSFHDYATRESVCGRGLFSVPRRRGRPPITGRPMTARERMQRMRSRRKASHK